MTIAIRSLTARVLSLSGLLPTRERDLTNKLTVLCYHRVLPESERLAYHDPRLAVTPELFAIHCAHMAEHFRVLPLAHALDAWQSGEPSAKPLAAINFDDGYRDNIEFALPVLDRFHLKATFFVIAGLVDAEEAPWYDRAGAAWLKRKRAGHFMMEQGVNQAIETAKRMLPTDRERWLAALLDSSGPIETPERDRIFRSDDLRRLIQGSHEIASHTMTHPILPLCDDASLTAELVHSRERLSVLLSRPIAGICFPNGDHDARVREAARAAGYTYAATLDTGDNTLPQQDPMLVRRIFVDHERMSGVSPRASRDLLRVHLSGLTKARLGAQLKWGAAP